MSSTRNPVAEQIERQFKVGDVWIVTREEERIAKLLKDALDEIDNLQEQIDEFEGGLEKAVEEKEAQLDALIEQWMEKVNAVGKDAKNLRNAAQSFVTQFDKIESRGGSDA